MTAPYANYPGTYPLAKADAFLHATTPAYRFATISQQTAMARDLVLSSGDVPDTSQGGTAEQNNSAVGRLKLHLGSEEFAKKVLDAAAEDDAAVTAIFQQLAAEAKGVAKKAKDEKIAATAIATRGERLALIQQYPGPNTIAQTVAMLTDKQPGFKLQNRSEQHRIAYEFLQGGAAR